MKTFGFLYLVDQAHFGKAEGIIADIRSKTSSNNKNISTKLLVSLIYLNSNIKIGTKLENKIN